MLYKNVKIVKIFQKMQKVLPT